MSFGRRKFLISGGATTLALSLATLSSQRKAAARGRWGALIEDPDGILDLPEGFSYSILETEGDPMDDGYVVPERPDGMACFEGPDDTIILMRNHENGISGGPYTGDQTPPPEAYDPGGEGGVTRVVMDANTFERISSNLVLVGSIRNCAGGPSPWGWLSCEETVEINEGIRHGYTFVCPIDAETVQAPQIVEGYGRYNHEAVAIDPSNNYAYLTEDRADSALYRFVPDAMAEPFVGTLQALKVVGQDEFQTSGMSVGDVLDIEWVDIDEPDPDEDTVRDEAHGKGAAYIVRGEGIWFFEGQVYIASTSGGPIFGGQIFRLIDGDSPTLELVVQSEDFNVLDGPDNITVAPWGELFIAEDGDGEQYIRWVTEQGEVCDFARNALSDSEFAGVCFSPDGRALFVNIQEQGLTLVVTGPFGEGGSGEEDTGDETADGGMTEDEGTSGDESGTDGGDGSEDEIGDDTTGDGTGDAGADDSSSDEGCGCAADETSNQGMMAAAAVFGAVAVKTALTDESEEPEA
ncbi:hypothetical protein PPSIR1_36137 [Plesiocystis pacifica SIR-1]|uniref:DUF839 domain-containing protein n=1 Tax=Plesiocystis pacifica SIR-1 TaxID=391625 RepID=A6G206_9BACT|nr:alkaline phosphatase PhoX [Plesiocystis pacifica]EDM80196.1 hypothetical protein PPSIR1_36137 [Plesiocystis pacifica SIR-1]